MFSSFPPLQSCSAAQRLDVDKHTRQKSRSPGRHDLYSLERSPRDHTPDYQSTDPKKSGYPKQDSTAPRSHSKYPEQNLGTEGGRSRHADPYPEHLLPSRGKHEDGYPEFESAHTGRAREGRGRDDDRVVRRKERPPRPPSPNIPLERDEVWNKERQTHDGGRDYNLDKHVEKDYRRDREQDLRPVRDREEFRDRGTSGDRHREQDRPRQKDKNRQRGRNRDRCLDLDTLEQGPTRDRPRESRSSWEEDEVDGERRASSRQRVHSNPVEVFDEYVNAKGRGDRETWDPQLGDSNHTYSNKETGTTPSLLPPELCGGVCVVCCCWFLEVVGFNQNKMLQMVWKDLLLLCFGVLLFSCDACRVKAVITIALMADNAVIFVSCRKKVPNELMSFGIKKGFQDCQAGCIILSKCHLIVLLLLKF